MKTIAVMSQKGGVGKTTLAYELAYWLTEARDAKVLSVDLDSQGTLTRDMGLRDRLRPEVTSYGLLTGQAEATDCTLPLDTGDLIPSCAQLQDVERHIPEKRRLTILRDALAKVGGVDYCILDCPPTMGAVNYNALTASDGIIIPTTSDYHSVITLGAFSRTVGAVREGLNPSLDVLGIVVTQWDGRLRVCKDYYPDIERYAEALGTEILGTVRRSVAVTEAQAEGVPILKANPKHPQAVDIVGVFERLGLPED